MDVHVRSATLDDAEALRSIEAAYGNLEAWPRRPDFLDHELAAGRVALAEHGGRTVGFAGAFTWAGATYLADAFVVPDLLGRGIGRAVVAAALERDEPRMTHASSDPRAAPLYARLGMHALEGLLYLSGPSSAARALPPGPRMQEAGPAERRAIAALDAEASGRTRPATLAFLAATPGGTALLSPAADGYGMARVVRLRGQRARDAFLGPIGAGTREAMEGVTFGTVRAAAERADRIHLAVFESHASLPALLAAEFRLVDRDTLMASRDDLFDTARYAPNPDLG